MRQLQDNYLRGDSKHAFIWSIVTILLLTIVEKLGVNLTDEYSVFNIDTNEFLSILCFNILNNGTSNHPIIGMRQVTPLYSIKNLFP